MAANEIFSSFYTNIQDRLKNPFYGAFIISWLGWNWEFVVLILYGNPEKIDILWHINEADSSLLFTYPFLSAIFFIIVAPWWTLVIQLIKNKATVLSKGKKFEQQEEILKSKEKLLDRQAEMKFIDVIKKIKYDKEQLDLTERRKINDYDEKSKILENEKVALDEERKRLAEKEEGFAKTEHDLKNAIKKNGKVEIDLKQKNEKVDSLFKQLLRAQNETEEIRNENKILSPEAYKPFHKRKAEPKATPTDSQKRLKEFKQFLKAEDLKEENLYMIVNESKRGTSKYLNEEEPLDKTTLEHWYKKIDDYRLVPKHAGKTEADIINDPHRIDNLKNYLLDNKISDAHLAQIVNESRGNISSIMREKKRLSDVQLLDWYRKVGNYNKNEIDNLLK